MQRTRGYPYDLVLLRAIDAGVAAGGGAVTLRFDGLLADTPGVYEAAVVTPAIPALAATLLTLHASAAAQAAGTALPAPPVLACSAVEVEVSSTGGLRLVLLMPPDATLRFDLPRDAAQALFSALSPHLAS
jgi:hypothetical protein